MENDAVYGDLEARAWFESAYALLAHHDFYNSAQEIFRQCKNLLGANAGYVALLSDDGSENEVLFLDEGLYDCRVDPELPMPIRGFRSEVYWGMKASYINDFMDREDFVKFMPPGHVRLENVLFAPLIIGGKAVGLMGLSNKEGGFNDQDLFLATRFAELAAVALNNSRTMEMLEERERTLSGIAAGAFDCIALLNSDGVIQFINEAGCELLSASSEELVGRRLTKALGVPENRLSEGISSFTAVLPDKMVNLEASVSHGAQGLDDMSVVILRDISERIRIRKDLDLADRKLKMMGRVTRHDVMNQLLILEGYAELFFDQDVPAEPKHGEMIKSSLAKIRTLYELQSEYEKLGSTEPRWQGLADMVNNCLDLLGDDVEDVSLELMPVELFCDDLMEKAVYNIIHNSLVHAVGSRSLGVATSVSDGELLLKIKDDGPGIRPEDKEKIFERGVGDSSGMGLFMVREILDVNQMTVSEEGVPGEGACFVIRIPEGHWRPVG